MDFTEYVVPIIAVAVYLLFLMIKPIFGDKKKWIPLCAGIVGVFFCAWFKGGFNFEIFVTGLASGLSATGIDQALRIAEVED